MFDGQAGYLDPALASAGLAGRVTVATQWHINSEEPEVLDYDTSFKPPAQDALYQANAYRSSDHDPVLVGLDTSVAPPPVTPPPSVKQAQTAPTPPKRIKKRGVTVFTKRNARTNAGLQVTTKVTGKAKKGTVRYFKVIKGKQGKVSVRTFGRKGWKLTLVQSAPAADTYNDCRLRTVYKNGKRR